MMKMNSNTFTLPLVDNGNECLQEHSLYKVLTATTACKRATTRRARTYV